MIKSSNTMKALSAQEIIDKSMLKTNQYTISLLTEALRTKQIDHETLFYVQFQIMTLLKDIILQFTKGESTSVSSDTAESLLCSLFYAIDAFTNTCNTPEEALMMLKTHSMEELYKKGIEQIDKWYKETKVLYGHIWRNRLNVGLEAYDLTISEAIPVFMKNYNMIFLAHNAVASIDYPLVFDDMSVQGVLYIKNYLEHFKIETDFCKYFKEKEISRLLKNFGTIIRMDYKIELLNAFELVFNNAFFAILSGKPEGSLLISKLEFDILNEKLSIMNSKELCADADNIILGLISKFNIADPAMIDYINRYKEIFIKRIASVVENNALSSIVLIDSNEKSTKSILSFEAGERMKDSDFNSLVKKLTVLSEPEEKITLLLSRTKSLYDFIDVLNCDCFFGDEYYSLYHSLSGRELAVLSRMVFYEEMRDGFSGLATIVRQGKEAQTEWQDCFVEFLKTLTAGKLKLIENYMQEIDYEEIKFY